MSTPEIHGRVETPAPSAEFLETTPELDVFVPVGDSLTDTAALLSGTADEFGIPARHIKADLSKGGFWISGALADLVYEPADEEPEPEPTQTPDAAPAKTGSKSVTKKGQTK